MTFISQFPNRYPNHSTFSLPLDVFCRNPHSTQKFSTNMCPFSLICVHDLDQARLESCSLPALHLLEYGKSMDRPKVK